MRSSNKDGGSAFPRENYFADVLDGQPGMSLRDWFAGMALQGGISGCAARGEPISYKNMAALAYEMADAMIEERESYYKVKLCPESHKEEICANPHKGE